MLEQLVKNCLPEEGLHAGTGKEHEEKGVADDV